MKLGRQKLHPRVVAGKLLKDPPEMEAITLEPEGLTQGQAEKIQILHRDFFYYYYRRSGD